MYANTLAYAMDQLLVHSNSKVRSFIYWYVWVLLVVGNVFGYTLVLSVSQYRLAALIVSSIAFGLFSISLYLHFF
jgi:hypothetical protein